MDSGNLKRQILTVSELTGKIKTLLEDRFSFIWIQGEISNLTIPSSGHCYFTLKDSRSQISSVIFRGNTSKLRFNLKNGLEITGFGRVSVYEPRGSYQMIFEYVEPKGIGGFQVAFEQLKKKLAFEGLFDAAHKREFPQVPQKISVITSPTGAVIHDIIHVISRRFPDIHLEVVPVQVQGDASVADICAAFDLVNQMGTSDLIILARGGGSLEDLQSFNSEAVARKVFASGIPVIAAVGHETDVTIADFVADLRAPTPSAAAELAVPHKPELQAKIQEHTHRLIGALKNLIGIKRIRLRDFSGRLKDPRRKLQDMRLRLDDHQARLEREISKIIQRKKELHRLRRQILLSLGPLPRVKNLKTRVAGNQTALAAAMAGTLELKRGRLQELTGKLASLDPEAVLKRGYTITRTVPGKTIVTDSGMVEPGQELEIILAKGNITVEVKGIKDNK